MNEIIARTPQVIAVEINSIKSQTRQLVLSASIEIGRRLSEAKAMIEHGQWGQWLTDSVDYSQRTAINLMRIFEEYGENQLSLLENTPNSQALANLSYTQAVALLGIAPEEREAFAEEHDIENISTRELEQAVKDKQELERKLKEVQVDATAAAIEAENADQRVTQLEKDLEQERKGARAVIERLNGELEAAKKTGSDKMVKDLEKKLAVAEKEAAALAEELKEVRSKPIEPAIIEVVPEDMKRELEQLRSMATREESPLITRFRERFETLTNDFQKLLASLAEIRKLDDALYPKYSGAAEKLISSMADKLT